MKRLYAVYIGLLVLLLLSGCSGDADSPTEPTEASEAPRTAFVGPPAPDSLPEMAAIAGVWDYPAEHHLFCLEPDGAWSIEGIWQDRQCAGQALRTADDLLCSAPNGTLRRFRLEADGSLTDEAGQSLPRLTALEAAVRRRTAYPIFFARSVVEQSPYAGNNEGVPYSAPPACRKRLSKAQKAIYDELLARAALMEDRVWPSEAAEDLRLAGEALLTDYPEYRLYLSLQPDEYGAVHACYRLPGSAKTPKPAERDCIREELAIFEACCDEYIAHMPTEAAIYDQYRYLALCLCTKTEPDVLGLGGADADTAYGALEGGWATPLGYARGFEYLCRRANLTCELVSGTRVEPDGSELPHVWNRVSSGRRDRIIDLARTDDGRFTPFERDWYACFWLPEDEATQYRPDPKR